jgi:hypothetical protein
VATRYDKLAVRYRATATIATINEWLRLLKHALAPRRHAEVSSGGPGEVHRGPGRSS